MKLPPLHLTLRNRLLLMMLALLLLSLASLAYLGTRSEKQVLSQIERRTQALSTAIQISVEQLAGLSDEDRLRDYVANLKKRGIKELSIVSNEEEVIASSNPTRVGAKAPGLDRGRERNLMITAKFGQEASDGVQRTHNLIVPIVMGDEPLGYAHIIMLVDDFDQLFARSRVRRLLVTLGVFGIGMMASVFLSRRYTRPIDDVVLAARKVAAGDLSQTLPEDRQDEIGELTRSFNEMVRNLQAKQELEERLRKAEHFSALGQLASGIAHEIRNPLNFINLSIDHLRARFGPAAPEDRETYVALITNIKGEIHRLNGMVENFLSYGKPRRLALRPCAVGDLLKEVVALAEQKAEGQGIVVTLDVAPELPPARVDGQQLKACFMNVVANAIQAMPGGGELRIGLRAGPGWLHIAFRDTGCGIAQEHLPLIFEPYFSTKEAGIGLGLALTRRVVEEHGGQVEVESVLGQGTQITLTLRVPAEAA
ncbi:MAG: HAMP domain-containing protein [Deltaproteobacteria bacterium]|nr:HAMP domain-containing protein [Deltaproteobacteria bacterium]